MNKDNTDRHRDTDRHTQIDRYRYTDIQTQLDRHRLTNTNTEEHIDGHI